MVLAGLTGSPPAPVADVAECWLPEDDQLMDEDHEWPSTTSSLRKSSRKSSHSSQDLAELKDLLQQHRAELGHDIEERMENVWSRLSQSEEFFQRLAEATLKVQGQSPKVLFRTATDSSGSEASVPHTPEEKRLTTISRGMTFEASELMKRSVSSAFEAPERSRTPMMMKDKTECRGMLQGFLESNVSESVLCVLIVCSCAYVGLEVQCTRGMPDAEFPIGLKLCAHFFTTTFTVELCLRIFAYGWRDFVYGENNSWNLVDTFLVVTSLLTTLMDIFFSYNPNFEYVRIVRMARTVRILRIVRIVKFFRPLRIIVYSVMNTMRSLCWMVALMLIIIYLFAVIFTYAATQYGADFSSMDPELRAKVSEHFGSLWSAILVLYKASTGGMDWTEASDPLAAIDPIWSFFFLVYTAVYNLAILNVITGVVCQTAIESARQDQDIVVSAQMAVKERYMQQLQDLFGQFHTNQQGKLTLREFESRLQDPQLQHYFEVLELTIDEAWNLFKLLDSGNTGTIDVEAFVSGCLKLRGNARSIDMHMLMYQSQWTMDKLAAQTTALDALTEQVELLGRAQPSPYTSYRSGHGRVSPSSAVFQHGSHGSKGVTLKGTTATLC